MRLAASDALINVALVNGRTNTLYVYFNVQTETDKVFNEMGCANTVETKRDALGPRVAPACD